MTGQTTRLGSSATLSNSGSSQLTLHSQWLSRNVSTDAAAASAPLTLDLINPSRLSLRSTRTFWILANSSPSSGLSLKSSTRMISLIRCSGLRLSTLTTVLSNVERASLWKVIITLVAGKSVLHFFRRHLEQTSNVKNQPFANTSLNVRKQTITIARRTNGIISLTHIYYPAKNAVL
jgi:hypothetical protein